LSKLNAMTKKISEGAKLGKDEDSLQLSKKIGESVEIRENLIRSGKKRNRSAPLEKRTRHRGAGEERAGAMSGLVGCVVRSAVWWERDRL